MSASTIERRITMELQESTARDLRDALRGLAGDDFKYMPPGAVVVLAELERLLVRS